MQLSSHNFAAGQAIPPRCAFGQPGTDTPFAFAGNASPHLAWQDVPAGTRSYALSCVDADVPSRGEDVNQPGRVVPANLPRMDFVHWLLADVPALLRELAEGACGQGIVAHGKRQPPGPAGTVQGRNDYSTWFAGDAAMAGDWLGYDGPCPPWNDSIVHRYHFTLYALDVATLGLSLGFTRAPATCWRRPR